MNFLICFAILLMIVLEIANGMLSPTMPSPRPSVAPTQFPSSSPAVDIITTIAGTGTGMYSSDGGAATSAALNSPTGVTVDSSGK